MITLPANARLCHRCAQHYIGRACPKCPPALASAPQASAGCGSTYGITTDARKATVFPQAAPAATRAADVPRLVLRLTSQIRGGKNGMGVTRTGRHYAKPTFARWRDDAVRQIRCQLPSGWKPIDVPCNVRLDYVAGDKRRRDMPAVLDAIFHALEKAEFCVDDTLIWVAQSSRSYDKTAPGCTITFLD
jgi:Holliday junction resolvase RusA-like endonuclease